MRGKERLPKSGYERPIKPTSPIIDTMDSMDNTLVLPSVSGVSRFSFVFLLRFRAMRLATED